MKQRLLPIFIVFATVFAGRLDAQTYCTPTSATYGSTGYSASYYYTAIATSGPSTTANISYAASGITELYNDYHLTEGVAAMIGSTITFTLTSVSSTYNSAAIYVDWNQNGEFTDAGEQVVGGATSDPSVSTSGTTFTVTIPTTATIGTTRLRIVDGSYENTTTYSTNMTSCSCYKNCEYVDFYLTVTPSAGVVISSTSPAAANIPQGTSNLVLQSFALDVTGASDTLTGLTITTLSGYAASDISDLNCWYSTSPTFSTATATLLSTITPAGSPGSQAFPSFSQIIPVGTEYLYITTDVTDSATIGDSLSLSATPLGNFSLGSADVTGSTTTSNAQTIVAGPYYQGNLVVEQALSSGTPTSAGTAISLRQYTTSGTLVNVNVLPSSGPSRIVISGTATSEGMVSLSAERDRLIVVGYDTTLGALTVASSDYNRVIGELPPSGTFNKKYSSSSSLLATDNIRSGTSYADNYFCASAISGAVYVNSLSATAIESLVGNIRYIQAYNNSIYFTSGSGSYKGLSELPAPISAAAGQVPTLVAADASANPYGFAISPDGNTAYVADATAGILKYTRTGGTGLFTIAGYTVYGTACSGLAVDFSNTLTPTIYATLSSGLSLISLVDAGSTVTSPTVIATTRSSAPFRGVMFAPYANAQVTITGPSSVCSGDSTVLTFTGNPYATVTYNVNGSPKTTTLDSVGIVTVSSGALTTTTTFSLVNVNNPSGTTALLDSVTVTVNPVPTLTVSSSSPVCVDGTLSLTGTASGGTAGYTYVWSGPGLLSSDTIADPTAGGFAAGSSVYTLTVTDVNNCSVTATTPVTVDSLPAIYNVTSAGSYCLGGPGVEIDLDNSDTGINYQLYIGGAATGSPVTGTGSLISFGLYTAAATYTAIALNGTTGCQSAMAGSVTVTINPLPDVYAVTGSGSYCSGGDGLAIGLSSSDAGATYQLYNGATATGSPVAGTGAAISFGLYTTAATYTVIATYTATGCPDAMADSAAITINPVFVPSVSISASADTVCTGTPVSYTATSVYGGTTPVYQWYVNGTFAATGSTYSYTPSNGDIVTNILTSDTTCAVPDTVTASLTMTIDTTVTPIVSVTATPGTSIAPGTSDTLTVIVVNGGSAPAYQWFVNSTLIPGATSATYIADTLTSTDSVFCIVGNTDMCGSTGFNYAVIYADITGIKQIATPGIDVQLVPNPNNGTFTLKGSLGNTQDQTVSLEITDMLGQAVYTKETMAQKGNINEKIQLNSAFPNGIYLLSLYSGNSNIVFHFVLKQ